jgi:chromate reductase
MSIEHKVAVLVGSLRRESINRKLAHAFIELAPAELKLSIVEIGDLPLYNQDLDETPPRSGCVSARRSRRPAPCFS